MSFDRLKDDPALQNIKETIQSAKNFSKFVGDTFFPNHIPRKPGDIIAMRDRLLAEEEEKKRADDAKQQIKNILEKRKQLTKAVKAARRKKIKNFFGRFSNTKEENGSP